MSIAGMARVEATKGGPKRTIRDLSRYYGIMQMIEAIEDRLIELRQLYGLSAPALDAGPKGQGPKGSAVESAALAIADTERRLEELRQVAQEAREDLEAVIDTADDPVTREAMRARFLDGLTWPRVADRVRDIYDAGERTGAPEEAAPGGPPFWGLTPETLRSRVRRFINNKTS